MNMFPNTHFVPTDDIIKYVRVILNNHLLVRERFNNGEPLYENGKYIEDNLYLEYDYFVIPKHFYLISIEGDDWADKLYKFGFLNSKNQKLQYSENESWPERIEDSCIFQSKKTIIAKDQKVIELPSELKPVPWMPADMEMIDHRINSVISRQNLKLVNQK